MDTQQNTEDLRPPRITVIGPLAAAYVPMQKFRKLYDPACALSRGTAFRELDLPFGREEEVRA